MGASMSSPGTLVIEDAAAVRRAVVDALRAAGFEPIAAARGGDHQAEFDDGPPLAGLASALEAARGNGELEGWRRDGVLPAPVLENLFACLEMLREHSAGRIPIP
jgi:DNA-binding response OmpR family regulator